MRPLMVMDGRRVSWMDISPFYYVRLKTEVGLGRLLRLLQFCSCSSYLLILFALWMYFECTCMYIALSIYGGHWLHFWSYCRYPDSN